MADNTAASTVQRVQNRTRHRRRAAVETKHKRRMVINCARPIIVPHHKILWCTDGAKAKQWLLQEDLPWWFFASFINFCARVVKGNPRSRKTYTYTVWQRRLLAYLNRSPLDEDELVEMMKWYLAGFAQKGKYRKGVVDFGELKRHHNPEVVLSRAQVELHGMVFSLKMSDIERYITGHDGPPAPDHEDEDEEEEEKELPAAPVAFHTFALPLRLGAPPSLEGTPGRVEQQHESVTFLAQAHEDDMRMRLD